MKKFIIALTILVLFLLHSCSVTEPIQTKTETIYKTQYVDRIDSIFIDRWHNQEIKNDTVYMHDSTFVVKYKWLSKTDTDHIYIHDTTVVEKPVYVTKEVVKNRWWPSFLILGVVIIGFILYKRYKK